MSSTRRKKKVVTAEPAKMHWESRVDELDTKKGAAEASALDRAGLGGLKEETVAKAVQEGPSRAELRMEAMLDRLARIQRDNSAAAPSAPAPPRLGGPTAAATPDGAPEQKTGWISCRHPSSCSIEEAPTHQGNASPTRRNAGLSALTVDKQQVAPNEPVNLAGMQLVVVGNAPPVEKAVYGRTAHDKPVPIEKVRDMMREVETPKTVVTERPNPKADIEAKRKAQSKKILKAVTYAPAQTYAAWVRDHTGRDDDIELAAPPDAAARERQRQRRIARQNARKLSKQQLAEAAEAARVKFGVTTLEREAKRRREAKTGEVTFAQEQQQGMRVFLARAPRQVLINLLAAGSQAFIIFTVFLSRNAQVDANDPSNSKAAVDSAPFSVLIFAFAGVAGSIMNIVCVFTLYTVLKVRGVKARSLPAVCKGIVWVQYFGMSCQTVSVVSFICYIVPFFDRVTDQVGGPASNTIFAVLQILFGILLLPMLLFVYTQAHFFCYKDLALLVSSSQLMIHYALNIELHQILAAAALISFSLYFLFVINDITESTAYGVMYRGTAVLGAVALLFSVAHYRITRFIRSYEKRERELDGEKEALRAGLRVPLVDKTACLIAHTVDKPSLINARGVVVGNGVDTSGYVTVLVEGEEVKLHEYQLVPEVSIEKQEEQEEMTELRAAELDYLLDLSQRRLVLCMMAYIVATQIFTALMLVALMTFVRLDNAAAIQLYNDLVTQGQRELGGTNGSTCFGLTAASAKSLVQSCTKVQELLCQRWEDCANVNGTLNPRECGGAVDPSTNLRVGGCIVPPVADASKADNLALFIVLGGVAGGLLGGCCGCWGTRCLVGGGSSTKGSMCLLSTLGLVVIAAIGAGLGAVLSRSSNVGQDTRCNQLDLNPSAPGVQRLSQQCVDIVGAYWIDEEVSQNGLGCIVSVMVTTVLFVLESSVLLSVKVRSAEPNKFACFEAIIFFVYTAVCLLSWVGLLYGTTEQAQIFEQMEVWATTSAVLGNKYLEMFGENFPLALNTTAALARQRSLAGDVWYSQGVAWITLLVCLGVQVTGLFFALFGRSTVWMPAVRIVLYVESCVVCFFAFIIYLTLLAPDMHHNLLAMLMMPAVVLYCFAVVFATQSDVMPIPTGRTFLRTACAFTLRAAPLLLGVIFFVGFAVYLGATDTDRDTAEGIGIALMALSGSIATLMGIVISYFLFNACAGFCCDTLQLLQERFFPADEFATNAAPEGKAASSSSGAAEDGKAAVVSCSAA